MGKFRLRVLSLIFAFVACGASDASALRRVALVIGNAKYEHAGLLANTLNDAHAMTSLLQRAGFDSVEERIDVGVVAMKRAVRDFTAQASNADIAVIYYSGHGIEASGVNYLIPVDAKLADAYDVEDETLPLDRLMLATANVKSLSLIILDACRENPFLRNGEGSMTRAVARHSLTEQPTTANTLVAYAAKAGSLSYDGAGPNSPFTTALVRHIAEPGLDIRIALGKVRDDVIEATGRRQEPFVYGSLGGATVSLVPPLEPSADPLAATAADYALAERAGTPDAWRAFIASHRGGGFYVELARAQLNRAEPPKPQPESTKLASRNPDTAGCDGETRELERLRANPDAAKAKALYEGLACAALRPQVQRLLESLGEAVPTVNAQRAPKLVEDPAVCAAEGIELANLRANPDRNAALAFAAGLRCRSLRPQAARLVESLSE